MFDYSAWLQRAIVFIQSTESLKAHFTEVETQIQVQPPIPELELQKIIQSLHLAIPESLQHFWTTATRECQCLCHTSNPIGYGAQCTAQIYDYATKIYCGFWFLNVAELESHLQNCRDWGEEMEDPQSARWWMESIPFIFIQNGDYIAVNSRDNNVVYLSHDEECFILGSNFDEFLQIWEQLCYVGPESWKLEPFINSQTQKLDSSSEKANLLRSLFNGETNFVDTVHNKKSATIETRLSQAKQLCLYAIMFSQDTEKMPSHENWQEELRLYAPDLFEQGNSVAQHFAMNESLSHKRLDEIPEDVNIVWFYEITSPTLSDKKIFITTDSNIHHLTQSEAMNLVWSFEK